MIVFLFLYVSVSILCSLFLYCLVYISVSILYVLCFCIVLCIVPPHIYSCFFSTFVQVYRPLSPNGNPTTVNKYHIIIFIFTQIGKAGHE